MRGIVEEYYNIVNSYEFELLCASSFFGAIFSSIKQGQGTNYKGVICSCKRKLREYDAR
jgi:hypothetical protein